MEHTAAAHSAALFTPKQKKVALFIVAFAFVMDLLDSTIVNIAIPSIQANLGASYATIQWLIAGYALTFALLLITGGRMGDVFGYKKIFLFGVAGFTITSLLNGIAPNPGTLVVARLLQGSMAALMVPQVMSLMQVMYKPEERSQIMGLFGMLGGLSASLGPIIGGLLIKANIFGWDWRPIFLINLPVGIFALIAGSKYLPDGKSEHPLHIDLKGTFLIIIALSLLVFPLIEGRDLNWPIWSLLMMAAAIPALWVFGWYEIRKHQRDQSALIVPSLFKLRSFNSGLILNVILESVMIGYFLTFTLILQVGLGFSAIRAALTGVPTAVGMSISFIVLSQMLIRKFGRNVIVIGCMLFASGLVATSAVLNHYGIGTHAWMFIPSVFLTGLGLALIMAPVFSAALQDVDPGHAGSASGILSAVQQVGGAIGIAVIGVIFFGQISSGAVTSFDAITPHIRTELTALHVPAAAQESIIRDVRDCYHDRTTAKDTTIVPASCKKLSTQNANSGDSKAYQAVGVIMNDAVKQANVRNFATAFRWSVIYVLILLVVACALSFTLPRTLRVVQEHA